MTLRELPSVDRLLKAAGGLISDFGRSLTTQAIRDSLDLARADIREGKSAPRPEELLARSQQVLVEWLAPTLRPVINASGVIVHTNLGRAPLSKAARDAMQAVAGGYSTLEYDLQRGERGHRAQHAERLLTRLSGAEAALIVNNNAAGVLLTLSALAREQEVLISRSQLVEIGGGFRIPEILQQSGATLREVGTTNRTHLTDFQRAVGPLTALIVRVHHSNFKIVGFTDEPSLSQLVTLGRYHSLPVLDDLGSGTFLDTTQYGLGREPTVQDSVRDEATVTAFSGDKLLGGPQAGLLVGRRATIDRLRRNPMARAVRPDKLCLAALTATLHHYVKEEAEQHIPVWQMIAATPEALGERAREWRQAIGSGEVVDGDSTVGGGSLPEETLPSRLLSFELPHPDATAAQLRRLELPIVARIDNGRLLLDPRTVLPEQEPALLEGLREVVAG